MHLFPPNCVVGVFRGYTEGGLEFHADLAIPYKPELHAIPMHGQFLLVQLETPEEAVLGRITALASQGKLSQGAGEEFNIRAVRDGRNVPDDLREQYLKYHVDIRVRARLEKDADRRLTGTRSVGDDVPHVLHAVDRLLQRNQNRVDQNVGASAGIRNGDLNGRRRDGWEL